MQLYINKTRKLLKIIAGITENYCNTWGVMNLTKKEEKQR